VRFELVPTGTRIDFIGKRHVCGVISLLFLGAGLVAIPIQGVHLGIDFAGGTEVQVRFAEGSGADEGAIRSVTSACGVPDATVIRYGEGERPEFLIRFRLAEDEADAEAFPIGDCPLTDGDLERLAVASAAGGGQGRVGEKGEVVDRIVFAMTNAIGELELRRVEYVGPRVGAELRRDGLRALGIACLLILIYITFRFSTRFAPGAIVALVHDIGITAAIFVIFGLEFDLRVLAALLAILGYSLNDTIIIYDRIRENMKLRTTYDLVDVLNRSINQTLGRTVLTSGTTMAVVLSLWILGGEVIRPFAIAMSIGIVVGTYSSVFIAAPTVLFLETRYGEAGAARGAREGHGEGGKGKSAKRARRGRKGGRARG
jgi:preprotein translocase subunit SecF